MTMSGVEAEKDISGDKGGDNEEKMDGIDNNLEYSVETENSYSVLDGEEPVVEAERGWTEVQRSKRRRANTGSVDEQTFHTMTNDEKLSVIFSKLIGIEEKQSMIEKFETSLSSNELAINSIRSRTSNHTTMIEMLSYKSLDLEARGRRKNLIVKGLCEHAAENCFELINEFLFNELELDSRNICIDRAHRIGKRRGFGISRRPMIVAFRDFQDTVRIMDRAFKLKGSRFGLDRDYPHEISNARKLLWNRYKELKAAGREVTLEYPARLVVARKVVEDAFPDWYEVLKVNRVEPIISEEVNAANLRAETRRNNLNGNPSQEPYFERDTRTHVNSRRQNYYRQSNDRETTVRGESDRENAIDLSSRRQSDNRDVDDDEVDDAAFYSNYVSSRMQPRERQYEHTAWGKGNRSTQQDGNRDNVLFNAPMKEYPPLPVNTEKRSGPVNYTAQGAIPKSSSYANDERGPDKLINNATGSEQQTTMTQQRHCDERTTTNRNSNGQTVSVHDVRTNDNTNQKQRETIMRERTCDEETHRK